MKPIKRLWAVFVLIALLGAIFSGCRRTSKPLEVALVLKTTVDTAEFWGQVMDGVENAAEKYGVTLHVDGASAETEIDEQIAVMEDTIAMDPDVIILVASDYDRLIPVTEKAVAAGIPVITMDSDVNTDARACYVASDNLEIGHSLGTELVNTVQEGQVAILSHSTTASSGIDRAQGARKVMEENGIEVVGVYDCGNDMQKASEITETLLKEFPNLAGFVCTNEVCNLAAAGQLVKEGLSGEIAVIGCDNSQQQIQYLEQNVIQSIVIQRPFNMGYVAVEQAVKVARGEEVPDFTAISCVSITRDNMYNSENQKLLFPF